MIDEFAEGETATIKSKEQLEAEQQGLIRLKDANFHWTSTSGNSTPGFSLRIPDLTFVKGKINLISGPTGSGKSSLLKVSRSTSRTTTLLTIGIDWRTPL